MSNIFFYFTFSAVGGIRCRIYGAREGDPGIIYEDEIKKKYNKNAVADDSSSDIDGTRATSLSMNYGTIKKKSRVQ